MKISTVSGKSISADFLASIPCADSSAFARETVEKLAGGAASALEIRKGEQLLGIVVYEIVGDVFFVLAVRGNGFGEVVGFLSREIAPLAKASGCSRFAFCTVRPGIIKQAAENGYGLREVVFEKQIA